MQKNSKTLENYKKPQKIRNFKNPKKSEKPKIQKN